jgi:serine/threonine-protein kinase
MAAVPPTRYIIAGRYEVKRLLGSGSFGDVYAVHDHYLNHDCALKLQMGWVTGPWVEAQILKQLDGEYIVKALNADLAVGRPYVVTELATHGTVADQIPPDLGVPVRTAVHWTRHACQGVARMHDHKLLHRDIKPENLFLNDRREALVGDLGLAALHDNNGLADTAGTLTTMAPEVAKSFGQGSPARVYSARSDVYSIGATLFWMLAGAQPVPRISSYNDVWAAPQPDVWDVAPHVPQGLRNIVNAAIARTPLDRYASPAALDSALGGWNRPPREWARTVPHPGHEQCFTGKKGTSAVEVCAVPTGTRTQILITARHPASGRPIKKAQQTVPRSGLSAGLRRAFSACE